MSETTNYHSQPLEKSNKSAENINSAKLYKQTLNYSQEEDERYWPSVSELGSSSDPTRDPGCRFGSDPLTFKTKEWTINRKTSLGLRIAASPAQRLPESSCKCWTHEPRFSTVVAKQAQVVLVRKFSVNLNSWVEKKIGTFFLLTALMILTA